MPRTVLVTGAAGFIGFHTALRLLRRGDHVIGFDNLNDYYDVTLKEDRLRELEAHDAFAGVRADLVDAQAIADVFRSFDVGLVVHLAAQVGVRASVEAPRAYVDSNVVGFLNVLECCRHHEVRHLVYASSSSVYGANTAVPFSVRDRVDHPISLYAATKRSNELMAHSYSHLFGLPTTGLRFFTVYGPWGRPDMALFLFAQAIVEGRPIEVFNNGDMERDFTFVDDIVEGVVRALDRPPLPDRDWNSDAPDTASSSAPYRLYNIGNDAPVRLLDVIEALESALGQTAQKTFLPQQLGDMRVTHADVNDLQRDVGYRPRTKLRDGVRAFADWFCDYYGVRR
jgi:UDP-glucuronate 4-epimerase